MVSSRSSALSSKLWRVLILAFAVSLIAAACGDDDDDDEVSTENGDDTDGAAGGAIEAVEPFFPKDADGEEIFPCGGYGFRLENGDLRDAFNEELKALQEDGTTTELITAYEDFSEDDVQSANELTVADFAPDAAEGESGGGLLEELQSSGSITIGIANEVPFGFVGDDGEATGEAPDVARAVFAELGIENVDAQVVEFGQLIGGLQARQYDMIAAGMFINEERAAQILFSDPDYCIREGLAVPAGNPNDIVDYQSFVDNPDLTLAVALSRSATPRMLAFPMVSWRSSPTSTTCTRRWWLARSTR